MYAYAEYMKRTDNEIDIGDHLDTIACCLEKMSQHLGNFFLFRSLMKLIDQLFQVKCTRVVVQNFSTKFIDLYCQGKLKRKLGYEFCDL